MAKIKTVEPVPTLEQLREQIVGVQREIREVELAPLHADDIRDRVRGSLGRLRADNNRLSFSWIDPFQANFDGPVTWSDLCMLHGVAKVEMWYVAALLEQRGTDQPQGLRLSERKAAVRELKARLFTLEVAEEVLICQMIDGGNDGAHHIRRAAADGRALLEAWK